MAEIPCHVPMDIRSLNPPAGPLENIRSNFWTALSGSRMISGRHVLSQILDLVDRKTLFRLVERCDAESRVRHFGRHQRTAGLTALGGFGQDTPAQSPAALRGRRLGAGDRQHGLCPGFDDHRPSGTDSHMHLHHRSPAARRALARRDGFRGGSLLRDGSR